MSNRVDLEVSKLGLEATARAFGLADATRLVTDLDLIAFGNHQISNEYLTVPHPRAHLRKFVVGPLAEIVPDFKAPGWVGEASSLLANCPTEEEAVPFQS